MRFSTSLLGILSTSLFITQTSAVLNAQETNTELVISNDRLYAAVEKASGAIYKLTLDKQDLLGPKSGSSGIGPYLDCYCIPTGFYTPGKINPRYKLIKGVDSTNTPYGGIVLSETYPPTGQILEQYWFLREGETGLHTFSRLVYLNSTTPFLRNLQEFRTLFRPNTPLWTDLVTKKNLHAPLPSKDAGPKQVTVQDATWYLGNTPNDPYVSQMADYFTKYTFSAEWRDLDVYGMYSNGKASADGSTFGAWLVMNTKDTYFGGPLHSDLTVDGIVYNYMVSNHHGDGTPNITNGFDRTIGPQYYHFNKGPSTAGIEDLRKEALQYYSPTWNAAFYDSIAQYVPNYVPTTKRNTFRAQISLPPKAKRPIAILSQNGVDVQDNVLDTKAYQYWGDIKSGVVTIPMVKAGTYRLTIYADGIFGQYTQDNIVVSPSSTTPKPKSLTVKWREESSGREIWRLGTPDKSSGEYRHGNTPLTSKPLAPPEYLVYWAQYDFVTDFPTGVDFKIGKSDIKKDWNYVHWSVFGGKANYKRPERVSEGIADWKLRWDMKKDAFNGKKLATFTVQLAGAKTAAGNTDVFNATEPYANLPFGVAVNGKKLESWVIPYYHSSSCAVRSSVSCYNVAHKFTFDPKLFVAGENSIVLSLPVNGTDYESALLPESVYVQYDALRLEIA